MALDLSWENITAFAVAIIATAIGGAKGGELASKRALPSYEEVEQRDRSLRAEIMVEIAKEYTTKSDFRDAIHSAKNDFKQSLHSAIQPINTNIDHLRGDLGQTFIKLDKISERIDLLVDRKGKP